MKKKRNHTNKYLNVRLHFFLEVVKQKSYSSFVEDSAFPQEMYFHLKNKPQKHSQLSAKQ